ncbi:MAG: hypothetical protein AAF539_16655, partial [Planctomycetota bacterium]
MLIMTLAGMTPFALSCYGSSWNRTTAIDGIAVGGCVWDQVVTTRPNSIEQFEQWLSSDPLAGKDTSLVTDDADLASSPISDHFDEITLIEEPVAITAASIEETRWAALMAVAMTALERKRVVWVHSRFLITAWDAPRDLFKDTHFHDVDEDDDDALPARFNDVIPPKITLDGSEHPDLLAAWMRTYGCQIQLIDTMLEVILQTIDPTLPIVLAGTSGYCLGQRNRIDHRYRLDDNESFCGASALYRVPMLTNLYTGLRVPELTALDQLAELICDKLLAAISGAAGLASTLAAVQA